MRQTFMGAVPAGRGSSGRVDRLAGRPASPAGVTVAPAHVRAVNPSDGEPSRTTTPVLASGWAAANGTSTLRARAAVQLRIAAPWLTRATVRAPLAAASATTAS
ncbi:hypothetical protein [Streptomyces phaeoluteigriseus]|uniref:hypothetical protein n=1 Tax=Streptomyces phaeoluteigriseus TaxID=114686 RepID=UPI0026B337F9